MQFYYSFWAEFIIFFLLGHVKTIPSIHFNGGVD